VVQIPNKAAFEDCRVDLRGKRYRDSIVPVVRGKAEDLPRGMRQGENVFAVSGHVSEGAWFKGTAVGRAAVDEVKSSHW